MKYDVGDSVVYTNIFRHKSNPDFYPMPGIVGVVRGSTKEVVDVQWPIGSTASDGRWCTVVENITKKWSIRGVWYRLLLFFSRKQSNKIC